MPGPSSTEAARPPVEQACFWLASSRRTPRPALQGALEVDVVIVGAGLTGLWSALHLKQLEPSLTIALLESRTVGHGASGRNAGMLLDTIDHSHGLTLDHFGRTEGTRLARLGRDNQAALIRFLEEHHIDVGLERTGCLIVALSEAHVEDLRGEQEAARQLGIEDMSLLDGEATRAEVNSPRYHGALVDPGCALVDPRKLVEGLAGEAERRGCTLHEGTEVTSFERAGAGVRVRTENGVVTARHALLCTNAYTHRLLPGARHRFIPLYDYVLVSEPLSTAQRDAIGWRRRQGVNDTRHLFKYYRLTHDDRILWGTSDAAYYPGGRVDDGCDHSERHYRELAESFVRHFPALEGLAFPHAWGGAIAATTRFTPLFGRALGGRVRYALGYTGHGLGTTHLAGRVLAHMTLEKPSPLLDLEMVRRQPVPFPPEPLRRWAVGRVRGDLIKVDAGAPPSLLLRLLDALGIGLSS